MNMNWYSKATIDWLIPDLLAKSFIPDNGDLVTWQKEGIESVVNLLEYHFDDVARHERAQGFKVLHSPIPDMCAPTNEQLESIVRWIDREINKGKKVLVHCFAGIGRTGTILTAYLMYKGEDEDSALKKVSQIGSGPQTLEQIEILEEFSVLLHEKNRRAEKKEKI
jgi:protein-tyrosine phosphatase